MAEATSYTIVRRTSQPFIDPTAKHSLANCAQEVIRVKSNERRRRTCTVALILMVVVISVILISGICSIAIRKTKDEESKSLTELLEESAVYPTGCYSKPIDDFSPGVPDDAPRPVSQQNLDSWGFNVTSLGITGHKRRLRFYIWLPPKANKTDLATSASDAEKLTALLSAVTGSVGLQYGDSCSIVIIPLSLVNNQHSGIRTVRVMPDSSLLYELSVEIPENLCFTNDTKSPCSGASWRIYNVLGYAASPAPRPAPCQTYDGTKALLHCRTGSCNKCRNILDRSYFHNNEIFCNGCC